MLIMDQSIKKQKNTSVIAERRMSGPAAARTGGVDEIAEMRQNLNDGIVEFEFTKADGTVRHAIGTTSEAVIPTAERRRLDPNYDENLASYQRRQAYIIWFWDLEKNEVRCFNTNRFERVINVEQYNRRIGNTERVGNIFIHRDVDDGVELTPETIQDINNDFSMDFAEGEPQRWNTAADGAVALNIESAEVGLNERRQPMLKIEFAKRANDNDPPYQICVNEIRRQIHEQYGVNIVDVRVVGRFQY